MTFYGVRLRTLVPAEQRDGFVERPEELEGDIHVRTIREALVPTDIGTVVAYELERTGPRMLLEYVRQTYVAGVQAGPYDDGRIPVAYVPDTERASVIPALRAAGFRTRHINFW